MRTRTARLGSLVALSLFAGFAWRVELELRGWEGLAWINAPHHAVPLAIAAFLAWTWLFVDAPSRPHRLALTIALAVFAAVCVPLVRFSLSLAFAGPWGLVHSPFAPVAWSALWWWLLTPTTVAGILRLGGVRTTWTRWALSQALFLAAPFFAMGAIAVWPQHGSSDAIHTIKSGLLVPPLVFALGLAMPPRPLLDVENV